MRRASLWLVLTVAACGTQVTDGVDGVVELFEAQTLAISPHSVIAPTSTNEALTVSPVFAADGTPTFDLIWGPVGQPEWSIVLDDALSNSDAAAVPLRGQVQLTASREFGVVFASGGLYADLRLEPSLGFGPGAAGKPWPLVVPGLQVFSREYLEGFRAADLGVHDQWSVIIHPAAALAGAVAIGDDGRYPVVLEPRYGHGALWLNDAGVSGLQDLFLWGGFDGGGNAFGDGALFDPFDYGLFVSTPPGSRVGAWRGLPAAPTAGTPSARGYHSAVWADTADRVVVWGGEATRCMSPPCAVLGDGALYDPTVGGAAWVAVATTNAPNGRSRHSAVWTGSQMVVWGGIDASGAPLASGGRFTPDGANPGSWTGVAALNAPAARWGHTVVWTGTQMLVWGGLSSVVGVTPVPLDTGARYDPTADTWTPMSTNGAPSARWQHSAVWDPTAGEMIIWGGFGSGGAVGDGKTYRPGTNTWADLPYTSGAAPSPRGGHVGLFAEWTTANPTASHEAMVIVGGNDCLDEQADNCTWGLRPVYIYDRSTAIWSNPSLALGNSTLEARRLHAAVVIPNYGFNGLLVWGGRHANSSLVGTAGAYRLDAPATTIIATDTFENRTLPGHRPCPAVGLLTQVPFDPVNKERYALYDQGSAHDDGQPRLFGQAPLALATYTHESAPMLVALIPHGQPDRSFEFQPSAGASAPDRLIAMSSGSNSTFHRRALAFFEVSTGSDGYTPNGAPLDRCSADWGSSAVEYRWGYPNEEPTDPWCDYRLMHRATTEPAWLIDLPASVFPADGALPPRWLPGDGPAEWINPRASHGGIDPRLADILPADYDRLFPPEAPSTNDYRLPTRGFLPGPPQLLIDAALGRGYLFVNRWADDSEGRFFHKPYAGLPGDRAMLVSFSLARPTGTDGNPDAAACSRSPEIDDPAFDVSNPFDGMYVTEAWADLQVASDLAPTAQIEAHPLVRGPEVERLQVPYASSQITAAIPYQPVALDAERQLLLVTQTATDELLIYDAAALATPPTRLEVGSAPVAVAVDGQGRAFVVNRDSDELSVIDLGSLRKVRDVPVGLMPVALHVDRERQNGGPLVYVLALLGDNLALYDPGRDELVFASLPDGCHGPAELVRSPGSREALVSCKGRIHWDGTQAAQMAFRFRMFDDRPAPID